MLNQSIIKQYSFFSRSALFLYMQIMEAGLEVDIPDWLTATTFVEVRGDQNLRESVLKEHCTFICKVVITHILHFNIYYAYGL